MVESVSEKPKAGLKPYHGFDVEELDLSEVLPPSSGLYMGCSGDFFGLACKRIDAEDEKILRTPFLE